MKILALTAVGAMLVAGLSMARAQSNQDANGVNRTGSANPDAVQMQNSTGSTTVPGNGTAQIDITPPKSGNSASATSNGNGAQANAQSNTGSNATSGTDMQGNSTGAPNTGTPQSSSTSSSSTTTATTPTPDNNANPNANNNSSQSDTTNNADQGNANRSMPGTSLNWLGMLLGGGFLSGTGLTLRRLRQ